MRPRSITGPLILVGLGVLFLINNLWHDLPVWSIFVDYWPLLLILIGVVGLVEVFFHASRGTTPPPRPLSGGGFFWVFVLILLVIWGSNRGGIHLGRINDGVTILGNDFDYDVNATSPAQGVTRIVLENIKGNVSLKGEASSEVRLTGHKTIRAFNHADADRAHQQSQVRIDRQGDLLIVRAPEPGNSRMLSISTDLDLVIPKGLSVETRGRAGDLSIEDIDGGVEISSGRGDVRLNRIGRDVKVESSRSGLVRATDVKGGVDLQGRGSEVQIENVQGDVKVNGEYSGTLEFRALAKSLHFTSNRSDMRMEQVPGSVVLDLGQLKINNVIGPVRFQTGSRDVDITDIANGVELTLDRGDIRITQTKTPLPKMEVRTRNGDITLAVPDKAAFDLDARTSQGEAQNDFGAPLEAKVDGRSATIKGKSGAGPQVTLNTDRGTLTIKKN